jgi:threonine synthase
MEENTLADSIAVGVPRNGEKALRAIRESDGICVNVSDAEILAAMRLLGENAGVFGEPAGVTGTAGVKKAAEQGLIPSDALVVSVVTGNGLKDIVSAQEAASTGPGLLQIPPDIDLLVKEIDRGFGRRE